MTFMQKLGIVFLDIIELVVSISISAYIIVTTKVIADGVVVFIIISAIYLTVLTHSIKKHDKKERTKNHDRKKAHI